jgi:AcrR family transcriptional regulator
VGQGRTTSADAADTDVTRNSPADADWWRRYDGPPLQRPHQAALDEFVEYGYHGTTIRRIAAAAEMSVPGLYYHFRSKEEILATLLRTAQKDVEDRRRAAVDSVGPDPRDRFVVQVEHFCLHTMYRQKDARLAREIPFLEEPGRSEVITMRDDLEADFYVDIARASDAGVFHVTDTRAAGRAVLALCRSIAGWFVPGGPQSPETIAQQYVEFALRLVGDTG